MQLQLPCKSYQGWNSGISGLAALLDAICKIVHDYFWEPFLLRNPKTTPTSIPAISKTAITTSCDSVMIDVELGVGIKKGFL